MTEAMTTWAEAAGLLCIALGLAWLTYSKFGPGWGLLVLGAVILSMSAVVAALAPRRKGGNS